MTAYAHRVERDWVREVLIVEDEPFIRGLVAEVVRAAGFRVATAGSAATALASLDSIDPEAVILDIELGSGPNGLDLAEALLAHLPHVAIVFLTQLPSPEVIGRTLTLPTRAAYLVKRDLADPRTLIDALETVLTDGNPDDGFRGDRERTDPLERLSSAQAETLRLVAEGLSNEEIAMRRQTSVRAAEAIVSRIFTTLGVGNDPSVNARVAATRIYVEFAGLPPATPSES